MPMGARVSTEREFVWQAAAEYLPSGTLDIPGVGIFQIKYSGQ
jgi:hypothetical protein